MDLLLNLLLCYEDIQDIFALILCCLLIFSGCPFGVARPLQEASPLQPKATVRQQHQSSKAEPGRRQKDTAPGCAGGRSGGTNRIFGKPLEGKTITVDGLANRKVKKTSLEEMSSEKRWIPYRFELLFNGKPLYDCRDYLFPASTTIRMVSGLVGGAPPGDSGSAEAAGSEAKDPQPTLFKKDAQQRLGSPDASGTDAKAKARGSVVSTATTGRAAMSSIHGTTATAACSRRCSGARLAISRWRGRSSGWWTRGPGSG